MSRAVVIMSGGDAATPFTTADAGCRTGLAAGNTTTALREHLLQQGHQVFTAPAHNGRGVVTDPDPESFGPSADSPRSLPSSTRSTPMGTSTSRASTWLGSSSC